MFDFLFEALLLAIGFGGALICLGLMLINPFGQFLILCFLAQWLMGEGYGPIFE